MARRRKAPLPTPAAAPAPARPRRWGRKSLLAICAVGAIAVVVIATTHPWWDNAPTPPTYTLTGLTVSFGGTGASDVHALNVCGSACPEKVTGGSETTLTFEVAPTTAAHNCSPTVYYTINSVVMTSTTGPFLLVKTTAYTDPSEALPVTIPYPYGSTYSVCSTNADLFVTFSAGDSGPSAETVALKVSVAKS